VQKISLFRKGSKKPLGYSGFFIFLWPILNKLTQKSTYPRRCDLLSISIFDLLIFPTKFKTIQQSSKFSIRKR